MKTFLLVLSLIFISNANPLFEGVSENGLISLKLGDSVISTFDHVSMK